jgi:alcohol dehydrogenase
MLGLTACCVAKTQGAQLVIAVDIDPSRLELARTFGADHCVLINDKEQQLTDIPKIDLALEFSGAEQSMKQGLEALNIGGSYVLAGAVFPGPKLQAAGEQIIRKMLSIYGVHNYSPRDLQDAILFLKLQSKNYPFQQLISKKFSLENIHEAFLFAKEETPLRVMIKP